MDSFKFHCLNFHLDGFRRRVERVGCGPDADGGKRLILMGRMREGGDFLGAIVGGRAGATEKAKEEADPCGMTTRRAKASATEQADSQRE